MKRRNAFHWTKDISWVYEMTGERGNMLIMFLSDLMKCSEYRVSRYTLTVFNRIVSPIPLRRINEICEALDN